MIRQNETAWFRNSPIPNKLHFIKQLLKSDKLQKVETRP